MKLKTFVAKNLKEALSQIKSELGPEAVILSTQNRLIKDGPSGLERQPGVEVTAAVDPSPQVSLDPLEDNHTREEFQSLGPGNYGKPDLIKLGPDQAVSGQLQSELHELKDLVMQLVRQTGPPNWLLEHQELTVFYRFLLKTGVNEVFLSSWLENIQFKLAQANTANRNWREIALVSLMKAFEVLNPWLEGQSGMQTWTFIGPTGVGKTTTLAKLAAHFSVLEKKKVALISLDNYRLGAQAQIEAFARIMGLQLANVSNRPELIRTLENFKDNDLILIDTAGRSPNHPDLITDLSSSLGGIPGLRHHLVLSASSKENDLNQAVKNFGALPLTSFIITKLDETSDFAGIFNLLCRFRTPISYLTTGQRVPEDLELASKRRISELLLNSDALGKA